MQNKILENLINIEKRENIKILYACESGSRVWGFNSADSDYDIRFFYVRPQEVYNTVYPVNYADLTLDKNHSKVIADFICEDLDYVGHDVQKALYLISKGNPDIISWLYSPIQYLITDWSIAMGEQAEKFFNTQAGIYHYAHMASRNFSQYISNKGNAPVKLKKYLYVIRPLICCMYIRTYLKAPEMVFESCLNSVQTNLWNQNNNEILHEIRNLIATKKSGDEMGYGKRNPILDKFCEYYIHEFMNNKVITPTNGKWTELDTLFNKIIFTQGGTHGSYLSPCKTR